MATVENQQTDTVTIEVDGHALEAKKGEMIIQVTDRAGIDIPRFCYHHKLSIAASCRMCLVDVEKAPKPLPACATPVADGMKVFTESRRTVDAQRGVMEFLQACGARQERRPADRDRHDPLHSLHSLHALSGRNCRHLRAGQHESRRTP